MRAQITTAGAYVLLDGRFVFMVGPTPRNDGLAVVRLGGHREAGETAWGCVVREVQEEASLAISPLTPPATYWLAPGSAAETLAAGPPPDEGVEGDAAPLLMVMGLGEHAEPLSAMYLAHAIGKARPAHEARGLLLLSPNEVVRLVCTVATLDEYRQAGGLAILRDELPGHLPLEPYLQLRALAVLLVQHPNLGKTPRAANAVNERGRG